MKSASSEPGWQGFGLALALLAAAAVFGLLAGQGRAAGPEEVLTAIQERYAGLTGLAADYTRVTTTPAMEGVYQAAARQTASGRLLFKKPAQLRLEQRQPRPEKLVTDGVTVWWYIPAENVVHRYTSPDLFLELKPLLDFLSGLDSLSGRFKVKVTPASGQDQPFHRLDLTSLKEGGGPEKISVNFAPGDLTLISFRLTAVLGETTEFTLMNTEINPGLSNDLFTFPLPPGAQVIDEELGQ